MNESQLSVTKELDSKAELLKSISEDVWKFSELMYQEFRSHEALVKFLENEGFAMEKEVAGLNTAFRATFGSGHPNVAFICEYDALPEIGHACGHNLIAAAGLGAGLGLKKALKSGKLSGRVTVLGTPAEEGGGGKIKMIEGGCFDDVDVAMMVHPTALTALSPQVLSVSQHRITFHGKEAHAAMCPWEGVNALDAAVMAYSSVSVLRQQMKPDWRVHGIIVHGGTKPNIIPGKTVMEYYLRAPTDRELRSLEEKVYACFRSAASATGCTVGIECPAPAYSNLVSNPDLASVFGKHSDSLGFKMVSNCKLPFGSTDMGNVSYVVPSIHPCYSIGSAVNHTKEFTGVSNTPLAHKSTLVMAKAMALAGLDILSNEALLKSIRDSFKKQLGK